MPLPEPIARPTHRSKLVVGALVIGPLLGFLGPIGVLVVAIVVLRDSSDRWFTIAPCAPFAYGVWTLRRPATRAFGIAVLVGTAGGLAMLFAVIAAIFSGVELTF